MFKKPSKTKEPENQNKAYEYAVFLLSLQLRTVGEVKEKMEKRGYTSDIIARTITQLIDQKYLNDERYAEVYLNNLKQYKNLGYYGIKRKFMAKKLPSEIIEKTLAEGLSVDDEIKIAKRLLKKEGAAVKPVNEDVAEATGLHYNTYDEAQSKQKQKLSAKLKSRGFRGEVIARLVF